MASNYKSIMNVLRIMDNNDGHNNSSQTPSKRSGQSSKSTIEVDLKFKMKMVNSDNARPPTPTPTADDECSNSSLDLDKDEIDPQEDLIRKKLSRRAYHLPGNSWRQDLGMYIRNNHLLIGICCHHRLHPMAFKHRLVILMGSLSFGLSITNGIYLYYLWGTEIDHDDTAFSISLGGDVVENVSDSNTLTIDISHGMAMLWTIGAALHSFFDLVLWHMIACGCIKQRCCKVAGWNMAVAIVMLLVAVTSTLACLRAYEYGDASIQDNESDGTEAAFSLQDGKANFHYLYGYAVELFLSLFVYSPLAQVLLFTGVLSCGSLPVIGGRPYEVRKLKRGQSQRAEDATCANQV